MQEIRHDGSREEVTPLDEDEMLKDPEVKEVRVFKTEKTLVVGADSGFVESNLQKILNARGSAPPPPPDDQQPIAPEQKEQQSKIPKIIPEFLLKAGMKINLHGTLYKVTAARSNGKVTMKFIRFLD